MSEKGFGLELPPFLPNHTAFDILSHNRTSAPKKRGELPHPLFVLMFSYHPSQLQLLNLHMLK